MGIVSNPASVDQRLRHVVDLLLADPGVQVGAIFGPQHGFRSDVQDNMIETPHATDPLRKVPVYSLYSETREPTAEMLRGLDALVIDLQDIGARIYTYIYTMANCLRAVRAARRGGRSCATGPTPSGAPTSRGPMLEAGFESFVGQFPIPMRHGMTIGELARLFNEHFGIGARLEVVDARGLAAVDVRGRDRRPLGDALTEHPHPRQRHRLSGHGALRGHQRCRRAAARRGRSS